MEVRQPILNDFEKLEKEAQKDFNRARENLRKFKNRHLSEAELMESIGTLLWTVRSNSMHGRKTTSGMVGPTNRDEQICELGGDVLMDLYREAFPDW